MAELKNIYQKIQAVSNEIKNITKNMTVGSGKFSYQAVSDIDVTLKVKDAEKKHRIVSIPINQEIISQEVLKTVDGEKQSLRFSFVIKMTTRIVDIDDPEKYIDIVSFGHGLDTGDKGFGKASTYARKYALLNAYKIATGDDPDNDPSKKMLQEKDNELRNKVINILSKDEKRKISVLKWAKVDDVSQLSEKHIEQTATSLKNAGLL